jgi:class 3 adenylate cyclase
MRHEKHEEYSYKECEKILESYKVHTERKRVIVAFADTVGFSSWIKRTHSLEEFHFLAIRLYRKILHMRKQFGYHVKFSGDGAMFVKDMRPGHNCKTTITVLRHMDCLVKFMMDSIARTGYPRPKSFRVRVTAGYVTKLNAKICDLECDFQKDYIGYPVNLASRMLDLASENNPVMCHESIKDLIGEKKASAANLIFNKVNIPKAEADGVDEEDLKSLWTWEFKKGEENEKYKRNSKRNKNIKDTLI